MKLTDCFNSIQYNYKESRKSTTDSCFKKKHYDLKSHYDLKPDTDNPMDLDAIKHMKLSEEEKEKLRKVGACYHCREKGHISSKCLKKKNKKKISALTIASVTTKQAELADSNNPGDPSTALISLSTLKVQHLSEDAKDPVRKSEGAAGYDLYAAKALMISLYGQQLIPTDITIEIPEGHYGQILPRSGLVLNKKISVDAGVIDPDYRGPLGVILINQDKNAYHVQKGDRITQLVIIKIATPPVEIISSFSESK
jgi:dUTP pyrophosphatase